MEIGYVCTNFNNSSYTREAVRTLVASKGCEYRIFVVDNNSDEQNVEELRRLKEEFPAVNLLLSKENVGYFRGLNAGIREMRRQFPTLGWAIIGNNDLEFPADFSEKLLRNMPRLAQHMVISPDVITVDGHHQNPHVISTISPVREIFYDLYYSNYHLGMLIQKLAEMLPSVSKRSDETHWQEARPIYQGHGSVYILAPRFFERFEELWAPTFLMSEEYFLSKQLSDVGTQVYYDPCLQIVHHWHASLAKLPSKQRWIFARDAHREYRKYVKVVG
jgi:GT2 family glycosyltransferase